VKKVYSANIVENRMLTI